MQLKPTSTISDDYVFIQFIINRFQCLYCCHIYLYHFKINSSTLCFLNLSSKKYHFSLHLFCFHHWLIIKFTANKKRIKRISGAMDIIKLDLMLYYNFIISLQNILKICLKIQSVQSLDHIIKRALIVQEICTYGISKEQMQTLLNS